MTTIPILPRPECWTPRRGADAHPTALPGEAVPRSRKLEILCILLIELQGNHGTFVMILHKSYDAWKCL